MTWWWSLCLLLVVHVLVVGDEVPQSLLHLLSGLREPLLVHRVHQLDLVVDLGGSEWRTQRSRARSEGGRLSSLLAIAEARVGIIGREMLLDSFFLDNLVDVVLTRTLAGGVAGSRGGAVARAG